MVGNHSIGNKVLCRVVGEVEAVDGNVLGGYFQMERIEFPF